MTNNQIQYWKYQEDKRHNLESESLGRDTLGETKRHNIADESVKWFSATEQKRHNVVSEGETERHNRADESVKWFTAQENQRHNLVYEAENERHNRTSEANQVYATDRSYQASIESANIGAQGRIAAQSLRSGMDLVGKAFSGAAVGGAAAAGSKMLQTQGPWMQPYSSSTGTGASSLGAKLSNFGSKIKSGINSAMSNPVVNNLAAGAVAYGAFRGMLKLGGALTGTDLGDTHYTNDYSKVFNHYAVANSRMGGAGNVKANY